MCQSPPTGKRNVGSGLWSGSSPDGCNWAEDDQPHVKRKPHSVTHSLKPDPEQRDDEQPLQTGFHTTTDRSVLQVQLWESVRWGKQHRRAHKETVCWQRL